MKLDRIRSLEALILSFFFFAANLRSLFIRGYFPAGGAWIEISIELILILPAMFLLWNSDRMETFKLLWLRNWPLIAFILVSAFSLIWTIDKTATLERVLILILTSLFAVYLATRYPLTEIIKIVNSFFAMIVFFCFLVVFTWPQTGVMSNYPYFGSWRGIFWHRNYLGSTMALGSIMFLLGYLLRTPRQKIFNIFYAGCYILIFALVILSRSATGLILLIILHVILGSVLIWLKVSPRLNKFHYAAFGGVLAAGLAVGFLKLNFLLGFFNRDANFTGRTGLWDYLLVHYVSQRPLLGFGFGAFWQQAAFDLQLRDALGWQYAIVIGDNGYIDILLHIGIIGLLIFVALLLMASYRSVKLANRERTVLAFVPFIVMSFMLISNITLSYFLETESFTWIIMIAMWFAATNEMPSLRT